MEAPYKLRLASLQSHLCGSEQDARMLCVPPPSPLASALRSQGFTTLRLDSAHNLSPTTDTQQLTSLLDLLDESALVTLLAEAVGTDVQVISLPSTSYPQMANWCRELSRPGEPMLRTHGPHRHPSLCESVRVFVALSDAPRHQLSLALCSHLWPDPSLGDLSSSVPTFEWVAKRGDVLVADLATWRQMSGESSDLKVDGDQENGGALMLSFTCAKFAYKQHAALRKAVGELAESSTADRPLLKQMLGIEIASELMEPKQGSHDLSGPAPERWEQLLLEQPIPPNWNFLQPQLHLSPPTTNDAVRDSLLRQFRNDGYLKLEGLMTGEKLTRLQAAFLHEQQALQEEWVAVGPDGEKRLRHGYRKPCASGRDVFDVSFAQAAIDGADSDVWLDLLEHPRVVSLLTELIGTDVCASEFSARTVPGPDGEDGYTTWHRDYGRSSQGAQWGWVFDHPVLSEDIKIFVLLNDQGPDQGVTSVVPQTHRVLRRPGVVGTYAGGGHAGENRPQESMEGHIKFTGKAGDAMMFDIRTHHTAMPNTSELDRQSIIIRYSPYWLKTGLREVGEALEAQGKLEGRSAMCRQLLGMELADGRHSLFEDADNHQYMWG